MALEILDPTHEGSSAAFTAAARLGTLEGARIALLSNGKRGTIAFFDAFARELVDNHGVAEVARLTKSNYSAPAEPGLLDDAQRWNALVAGVGD